MILFIFEFRAECSLEKLRALNDYVKIHISTKPISELMKDGFEQFTVNKYFFFLKVKVRF